MENKNIQIFKDAKYGLMMHFGLYTLLGGQYMDRRGPYYAEWVQCHQRISVSEMRKLAAVFNPIYFDAEKICRMALACGMKYIVITTKHHEGFCLFDSKVDDFTVCRATPCGRDLIKELADACRKYGLKLGFYYSQCIDWNEKDGGGYTVPAVNCAGVSWENSWDFPNKEEKNFDRVFYRKMLPQIEELCRNYGDIFLFWFDMPLDSTKKQSTEIYELVKKYQPDCLINSRLGNGAYDYVSLGDNEIPTEIPAEIEAGGDPNDICGFKYSPYGLYESACTINPKSWGYSTVYHTYRSPETICERRLKLEKLGINYLLNVAPDWLGRIPVEAEEILTEAQKLYLSGKENDPQTGK